MCRIVFGVYTGIASIGLDHIFCVLTWQATTLYLMIFRQIHELLFQAGLPNEPARQPTKRGKNFILTTQLFSYHFHHFAMYT